MKCSNCDAEAYRNDYEEIICRDCHFQEENCDCETKDDLRSQLKERYCPNCMAERQPVPAEIAEHAKQLLESEWGKHYVISTAANEIILTSKKSLDLALEEKHKQFIRDELQKMKDVPWVSE